MRKEEAKIGLALSGGGMRAAIFHLGVLKYLAVKQLLGKVSHISTVSGASICVGLIYCCHENTWPDDKTFLEKVLPNIKAKITKNDIQWSALFQLIYKPYYWDKKVNLLGNVMEKKWGFHACLQDISKYPTWTINTTCFETGKDFRIAKNRMGEQTYVKHPQMQLSHAMAASAGFPVLIGPYKLKTSDYNWNDKTGTIQVKPRDKILHLWDGGVYDNMGLDPLFHMIGEDSLSQDINYLIISNASAGIEHKTRTMSFSIDNLKRLLDINMDQVNKLKTSNVIELFQKQHNGVLLKIGTTCKTLLAYSDLKAEEKKRIIESSLSDAQADHVKNYKTSLERVTSKDFDLILKHGFEVAACTLECFGHIT